MKGNRLIFVINLVVIACILWAIWPSALQGSTPTPSPSPLPTPTRIITLSTISGTVGQSVIISGTNFNKNGVVSSIQFGTFNVAQETFEIVSGKFTADFMVPALPKGVYNVAVSTNFAESASTTFTIQPRIMLSTPFGRIGDQIVVYGDGFAASSKVSLFLDYAVIPLTTASCTSAGIISGLATTLPETTAGTHLLRLVDASGNSASINYQVMPVVRVEPMTVIPGGECWISGAGFAPASQISVNLFNRLVTNQISTDSKGTFPRTRISIPPAPAGNQVLVATDFSRNSAIFILNVACTLAVTPASGLTGSRLTINGSGFLPYAPITISYNGKILSGYSPAETDETGSFGTEINIPLTPSGTYIVTATDKTNTATARFTALVSSGLETDIGKVGDVIPIGGSGFAAGANITIKYDGVNIARVTADASGSFRTTFQVPARGGTAHKILVSDGFNPVSYNFTTIPVVQINNAGEPGTQIKGHLGSEITFNGSSFTPGNRVSFRYGSFEAATATVNADGTFSAGFAAPLGRPGKNNITVSDGFHQFAFTFLMESDPPPAPTLISPASGSRSEKMTGFQWSRLSDPSGVTYTLQIDKDSAFNAPLLEKTDLKTNSYQLSEEELLIFSKKHNSYHWRVRAVDGVFNEGQWSPVFSFGVSYALPSWIWYSAAGTAALLVLTLGYMGGRKWPGFFPGFIGRIKTLRLPSFKKGA